MAMELQQLMNAQFPHDLILKIRMRAFPELCFTCLQCFTLLRVFLYRQ